MEKAMQDAGIEVEKAGALLAALARTAGQAAQVAVVPPAAGQEQDSENAGDDDDDDMQDVDDLVGQMEAFVQTQSGEEADKIKASIAIARKNRQGKGLVRASVNKLAGRASKDTKKPGDAVAT